MIALLVCPGREWQAVLPAEPLDHGCTESRPFLCFGCRSSGDWRVHQFKSVLNCRTPPVVQKISNSYPWCSTVTNTLKCFGDSLPMPSVWRCCHILLPPNKLLLKKFFNNVLYSGL